MTNPIGVFDSGLGGLTVWRELLTHLPNESFVYYGDSSNCPYGSKSKEEILASMIRVFDFFLEQNCKLIVIACNTATAMAVWELREKYSIPVVGMEPAVKPALLNSKTGCVGVLATRGTIDGDHFKETSEKYENGQTIITRIGDGLVEVVENNTIDMNDTMVLLREYIEPMILKNVDHIVLGCTHYHFLKEIMREIVGDNVELIETSEAIARQTIKLLEENNITANNNKRKTIVYSSGSIGILNEIIARLIVPADELVEVRELDLTD